MILAVYNLMVEDMQIYKVNSECAAYHLFKEVRGEK